MAIDQEMGPQEAAAANAELAKMYEDAVPDNNRHERYSNPDGGLLNLARDHRGQRLLHEIPENVGQVDGDGKYIGSIRYMISEAGELVNLETMKPAPAKALEFATVLKPENRLDQ